MTNAELKILFGGLGIAVLLWLWSKYDTWRFDQKYGRRQDTDDE